MMLSDRQPLQIGSTRHRDPSHAAKWITRSNRPVPKARAKPARSTAVLIGQIQPFADVQHGHTMVHAAKVQARCTTGPQLLAQISHHVQSKGLDRHRI